MGILGDIFHKIFPGHHQAGTQAGSQAQPGNAQLQPPQPQATQQPQPPVQSTTGVTTAPPATTPVQQVDVEQILSNMQQQAGQQLNWRTSIVDLLKLLNLDSSLQARKALAAELHYTGDTNDSASMNIWLHRQVMNKLAENGGKVPADLRD